MIIEKKKIIYNSSEIDQETTTVQTDDHSIYYR